MLNRVMVSGEGAGVDNTLYIKVLYKMKMRVVNNLMTTVDEIPALMGAKRQRGMDYSDKKRERVNKKRFTG